MKVSVSSHISSIIMRQVRQMEAGGWPEVKRKLGLMIRLLVRTPILLIAFVPALLFVLVVRLIRPVFLIRFQELVCWRIGHFASNTEMYLCEMDAGINKPKTKFIDIWYYPCAPCNRQLARMWGRVLHIGPEILFGLVDRINTLVPGGEVHRIGENTKLDRDVHNLLDKFPSHLGFLPAEEKRGEAGLRALGIPEDAPFVCLIVRDNAYLNNQSSHLDWSRHNFRDCDIQNYVLAARKLAERGYYVVRMGAVVKEPMDVDHPMIIDYATNGMRSDFLDIYLGAKCTFCISNSCGLDAVSYIFRRPIVYVDMVPLKFICSFSSRFLTTFKKHWLREEGRFMTFREIFESDAHYFGESSSYEAMGIDLMESTPEEIVAVVLEMEERLKGTWQATEEDVELQRLFWAFFPKDTFHGEKRSSIGSHFLRQNKDLLQ